MLERIKKLVNLAIGIANENSNNNIEYFIEEGKDNTIIVKITADHTLVSLEKLFKKDAFFAVKLAENSIIISKVKDLPEQEFEDYCTAMVVDMTLALAQIVTTNVSNLIKDHSRLTIHDAIMTSNFLSFLILSKKKKTRSCVIKNHPEMEGYWPVHTAAKFNDFEAIQALHDVKENINQECEGAKNSGIIALHVAILNRNYEASKTLLKLGASITHCCRSEAYPNYSALMFACKVGDLKIINLVLKHLAQMLKGSKSYRKNLSLEIEKAKKVVGRYDDFNLRAKIFSLLIDSMSRAAFRGIFLSALSNTSKHTDERDETIVKLMGLIKRIYPEIELKCVNKSNESENYRNVLKIIFKTEDESILQSVETQLKEGGIDSSYLEIEGGFRLAIGYEQTLSFKLDEALKNLIVKLPFQALPAFTCSVD